jgi:hypothetical protein
MSRRRRLWAPSSENGPRRLRGGWYEQVTANWIYLGRPRPGAPYERLIEGYAALTERNRSDAERYVRELLTRAEVDLLRAYLGHRHGLEVEASWVPLPAPVLTLDGNFMGAPFDAALRAGLAADEDYPLPFLVAAVLYGCVPRYPAG